MNQLPIEAKKLTPEQFQELLTIFSKRKILYDSAAILVSWWRQRRYELLACFANERARRPAQHRQGRLPAETSS